MRRNLFAALVCTTLAVALAMLVLELPAPAAEPPSRRDDRPPGPEPKSEPGMPPKLADYRGANRVLVVFAHSPEDEDYRDQRHALDEARDGVKDRDLVLIEVFREGPARAEGKFLARAEAEAIRSRFKVEGGRYALVLVGKDGGEKARWYTPIPAEAVFGVVDAMPMRRREVRERQPEQAGK